MYKGERIRKASKASLEAGNGVAHDVVLSASRVADRVGEVRLTRERKKLKAISQKLIAMTSKAEWENIHGMSVRFVATKQGDEWTATSRTANGGTLQTRFCENFVEGFMYSTQEFNPHGELIESRRYESEFSSPDVTRQDARRHLASFIERLGDVNQLIEPYQIKVANRGEHL